MAAPIEVAVCTDSSAQLWSCVVWELHSGANLLTYRGGQAGPRGLTLLNGEYLLAAQLGKNYISAWELQRKVRRRVPGLELRWGCAERLRLGSTGSAHALNREEVSVRALCVRGSGVVTCVKGRCACPGRAGRSEGAGLRLLARHLGA